MPINNDELLSFIADLCRENELQVTVKESLKGGAIAGISTMLGGLVFGPVGLALGGVFGGITAAMVTNDFKSVADIILNDLTDSQRKKLIQKVKNVFSDLDITDIVQLGILLTNNTGLNSLVISEIKNFVNKDLLLQLK